MDQRNSLFGYTHCKESAVQMFSGPRKKSFFRSANAIFGKVGRTASEEITLELLKSKCIPILIYSLECFTLPKSDCYAISNETVQIVRHGCNSRMSAIFWF